MDSSPVNPYLLFETADSFRSKDKVSYALSYPLGQYSIKGIRNLSQISEGHYLVRSIEELRRLVTLPMTPNTGVTLNTQLIKSSCNSPGVSSAPIFPEKPQDLIVNDTEGSENEPWDSVYSGTSLWRWPVEMLYQKYHMLIAIDFSVSTFSVSKNGKVMIDYVSYAIEALFSVIEKTLETREQESLNFKRWITTYMEETDRENILKQVWNPSIEVSIVLINVPKLGPIIPTFPSSNVISSITGDQFNLNQNHPHLFPVDAFPFPTFEFDSTIDPISYPTLIPLITKCNAVEILRDKNFIPRLEETLRNYEEVCRSRIIGGWSDRTLFATIEHLVRLVPERTPECTSLILISNVNPCSHDSISLLESSVRRKNIILSLLFLSTTTSLFDSHTSPLSQFLSTVGGFCVHFNSWISLSTPRLNIDWCRRFGGPRCLAQQLFVQLEIKFPVSVVQVSQNMPTTNIEKVGDPCVLYSSDDLYCDFALQHVTDVSHTLRCIAEARFNQGWSVVMKYDAEYPHIAYLYARYHHNLRRGKLIISYEMEIDFPLVRRRVLVSGTKVLVDHFIRAKREERVVTASLTEAKTGWLTYLMIIRSQLHSWMRAEQVALQCLLTILKPHRSILLEELQWFSSHDGVSAEWSSHCSVRSIGFFFRCENDMLQLLDSGGKIKRSNMPSVAVIAARVFRNALQKKYQPIGVEENNIFISINEESNYPKHIIQIFLLDDTFVSPHEGSLALGFECRFSLFSASVNDENDIISKAITDVKTEISVSNKIRLGEKGYFTLIVEADIGESNSRALHLSLCSVSPRHLELVSTYSEPSLATPPTNMSNSVNYGVSNNNNKNSKYNGVFAKKVRTVQQLTFRCFLTPYLVSPWVLSDTLVFYWAIGTAETWRTFAEPSFNFFVSRRVRDGFRLLHCLTQRKAILYSTRMCGESNMVDIFDVIEVPLEGNDTEITAQVIIYRYVRPFKFALSPSYKHLLTSDISEDVKVATVVHTFTVLCSTTLPTIVEGTDCVKEVNCGFVQLTPRLKSLLPFLSSKNSHTITLHSLPSLGEEGSDELKKAICRFVSLLGDRSATVDGTAISEIMQQKLFDEETYRKSDNDNLGDKKLFFSLLMPFQCSKLTFLLMPSTCKNETSINSCDVTVHIHSLDEAALYNGVMRLYSRMGENEINSKGLPENLDIHLVEALNKLLVSFSSLYQAWLLLGQQRDGVQRIPAKEELAAQDILRVFSTFQDYHKEIDISHLLYVEESKMKGQANETSLPERLCSLISSMMRSMCLRPLPMHPAIFLPVKENTYDDEKGILGDSVTDTTSTTLLPGYSAHHDPTNLPFLVKIALLFISENDEEKDCTWVLSQEACLNSIGNNFLSFWSPIIEELSHNFARRRLVMHFFVKTAPKQLVNLSSDKYNPPVEVIRRILGEMLHERQEKPVIEIKASSRFFTANSSVLELDNLSRQAMPFEELPSGIQHFFDILALDLTRNVAHHCLTDCFHSTPFEALRSLINDKRKKSLNYKLNTISNESDNLDESLDLKFLAHESKEVLREAPVISGLMELLAFAVSPALLSVPCFVADSFSVEFTQQSTCSRDVNPTQALLHVFTRCLADDLVCVIPANKSCFLFVPNREYFALRWILMHVTTKENGNIQNVCLLFSNHQGDSSVCWSLCKHLRQLIEMKVREVSQLHLLKQLRDTQNANNELIPYRWGDQFASPLQVIKFKKESTVPPLNAFYCRGTTVLKIPVYYKLQHQCKKILSRIATNSSRLELISIYNREQCFVVADDAQEDTFHYIRLVFVKDTAHLPLLTAPSPSLSPADRCPLLVVQLFSATKNARVDRPLRKLQDFCFFMAVQELQGHLNYVQHKVISAVDLIFLQYQRLDPICIDLIDIENKDKLQSTDIQLAFVLVVLGLKENRFKYFQVQDGRSQVISNFIEHYGLLGGEDNSAESRLLTEPELHETSSNLALPMLRFVKVIEGVTDVLVSCALRVVNGSQLIVEPFLSKVPEERYSTGESEKIYLKQIDDILRDAVSQWRFFTLSKSFSTLSFRQVVPAVGELMQYGANVTSTESSTLRYKFFSLDRVSNAVFPFLIERLTGVFEPFSPVCFECRPNATPSYIVGFPWRWIEQLQGDPLAERVEFYITCGYQVKMSSKETEKVMAKATRALPVTHPDLPITKTMVLSQSPLLKEHSIELKMSTEPRAVTHISLIGGVKAAIFNLRDSDILLRLIGHVIAEAEQQSDLLHDIMIQRMGFPLISYLTEPILARFCCGDYSNVSKGKKFIIYEETYRRRINHVRFPLQSSVTGDIFAIIVEGLFNRGLFVNGTFVLDDAIKVLYNECHQYSLKECRKFIQDILREGLFTIEQKSPKYRVTSSNSIPDDALIGCSFRRHIQVAHILVESQHSRSGIVESLQRCESLWNTVSRDAYVHLAKSVVLLQQRSNQIFGSRVPDFTLLRRAQWNPSDDILDPNLPLRNQLGSEYCPSVDAALYSYVQHLKRVFTAARIIDLDTNSTVVSSDATLLSRLQCRHGKVITPEGNEIRFIPHLYYALIPITDSIKAMGKMNSNIDLSTSINEGGLFIVEIGFQVVHFALDVFMVNGGSHSTSITAQAAAWFKQSLAFSSVLYDLTVSRLLHCIQMYETVLPGQLQTSDALENLVKYYPYPPHEGLNIAVVFDVEEPFVLRMRKLMVKKHHESFDSSNVRQLIPEQNEVLLREVTREKYHYCGLMVWSSSRLFVLLSTVRDPISCERCPNGDLYTLALRAKGLLLKILFDSTLPQQLESVWDNICTPMGYYGDDSVYNNDNIIPCLTLHDLHILQLNTEKISLDGFFDPFLKLSLDWKSLLVKRHDSLSKYCLPNYALHLITDESLISGDLIPIRAGDFFALTLAPCKSVRVCFIVIEFETGIHGVIKSALLYQGMSNRSSISKIKEEEIIMTEQMLKILSSVLWDCTNH